jgi:prepilin-type N-terminal cleavage/methylation domain-containing protein
MTTTRRNRPPSRRAFSLIELMIVILIIALIIAIVVPALGHARKAARNSATRTLMVQIEQACSSFQISERRTPGFFSALEMGSVENADRGFTEMENVLLDLAGGVVPTDGAHPAVYGPVISHLVAYDVNTVGTPGGATAGTGGTKAYFTPPAKYFKLQDGIEGGTKVTSVSYHTAWLKDLVDAEGTPILMWRADVMSVQPILAEPDFAKVASGTAQGPARYYWNSNAAFLKSTQCGDKRIDQTTKSLLGSGNTTGTPPANIMSMVGILGNPSSPNNVAAANPLPTAGRGSFILQAAGSNCTFVGKEERGGKTANNAGTRLDYGLNFRNTPSSDLMADFDDILVAGGG